MILTIIGIVSGLVTLLVFLTGKPSILHFLPLQRHQLKELLPSPNVKWKFIVKQKTLFFRGEALEVAMLAHLNFLYDYRILSSSDNSKFLIAYGQNWEISLVQLLSLISMALIGRSTATNLAL